MLIFVYNLDVKVVYNFLLRYILILTLIFFKYFGKSESILKNTLVSFCIL